MPSLRRSALAVALLAAAVAGCDFTPALDIETPDHEPGVVIRSILVADSVAVVRVGESWDPYRGRPSRRYGAPAATLEATVTLLRDGVLVERLAVRSVTCEDYSQADPETGGARTYECGPYAGTVPVEAGGTYTVRVERAGLPSAEGTVTIPLRPAVTATEGVAADGDRQFRVQITDPAGRGERYGLSLLRAVVNTYCDLDGCAEREERYLTAFTTADPVLLAAAREIEGDGIGFASFTDETFDGRTAAFTISPDDRYWLGPGSGDPSSLTVQVAALSADVYDVYQLQAFGGVDDENPFVEPANVPSNVVGGYGLVGGLALAEITFGTE